MKKIRMPETVESFSEVDRSKNRPKTRPRFVKSIQNKLRKKYNLIEGRFLRAEIGLAGRENGV